MYKISPSDLTFSWDGCKYCFYLKVKHNIVLRGPFPGMFTKMANLTSEFYLGKLPTSEISPDLPPGICEAKREIREIGAYLNPRCQVPNATSMDASML